MYVIKQSTDLNIMIFCHDSDGDAVTGLVDGGFTKRISKNGGAFAAMTVTITEAEGGWYSLTLTGADHTNTTGILTIYFTHASCEQVNLQFRVETRILDNLAFPTTSGRSIDVTGTGEVGLDLDNTNGTLAIGTEITGGALEATVNALAASLALAAYDPPTNTELTTIVTAHSASLALAAYDGPTKAEVDALAASLALAAYTGVSTALAAYDPPTHAEMTAEIGALNDITVADILAGVIDSTLTLQDSLKYAIAWFKGRIVKASTALTYYSQTSTSLWVNNITSTDRNIG